MDKSFLLQLLEHAGGEPNSRERKLQLLSRFLDFRAFGLRRAKKQSFSTLQGLRVDTGFVEF